MLDRTRSLVSKLIELSTTLFEALEYCRNRYTSDCDIAREKLSNIHSTVESTMLELEQCSERVAGKLDQINISDITHLMIVTGDEYLFKKLQSLLRALKFT